MCMRNTHFHQFLLLSISFMTFDQQNRNEGESIIKIEPIAQWHRTFSVHFSCFSFNRCIVIMFTKRIYKKIRRFKLLLMFIRGLKINKFQIY